MGTSDQTINALAPTAMDCAPAAQTAAPAAQTPAAPHKPPQSLLGRFWSGWVKPIGMAMIVVFTLRSAVADWNDVPSQSMEPTILIGDRIFVNKLAYDLKVPFTTWHLATWGGPERGDVVVFYSPTDGKRMVKRVVGVPGDKVQMVNDQLRINGKPLAYQPLTATVDESQLADPKPHDMQLEQLGDTLHTVMAQPRRAAMKNFGPIQVPQGQYFMMGDNRDNSGDSRYFGAVPRDAIVGKAVGLAFSLDHNNGYWPRWSRCFRGL
jgi:signal peptidase I